MIEDLRQRVATAVQQAVQAVTGEHIELPSVENPPRPEFGDLAVPAALELGCRLERQPRQLAEELLAWLESNPAEGISRWQIAGPGYLNAFFDRGYVLDLCLQQVHSAERPARFDPTSVPDQKNHAPSAGADSADAAPGTFISTSTPLQIVEHTSINPNKAAHIGHLRNACLGDTLARVLRFQGVPVEVQNYIDDTGVQVADVVLGFIDLRNLDAEAVAALPEPFDYTCWDMYAEVTGQLEDNEQLQERRRELLLAMENESGVEAAVGSVVADRISHRHLATMRRLGIEYDLLVREGDVVGMDLWSVALGRLQQSDRVYFAEDGKNVGCWVLRLDGVDGFEDLEDADKILVRSNGTATYVAKDIAYHMWKYGLLPDVFTYERFAVDGEHVTYRSARAGGGHDDSLSFGGADSGYNVIDVRQSYLQQIVGVVLALLSEGSERKVEHTHFAYEMVALTPRTAEALGIPVADEDRDRAYVEMSGRRGYGVKADDLLNVLQERAAGEVADRNPELDEAARNELGRCIAVGALRYFLVRFNRNTVIAFDMDDALSFEGETGPYLQYAGVRARSIFQKIEERWGKSAAEMVAESKAALSTDQLRDLLDVDDSNELWGLVVQLIRLERVCGQTVDTLEISTLAKYAFGVAQAYNQVYHRYPILQEEDAPQRALRILLTSVFLARFEVVLSLLGIPEPQKM